MTHTVQSSSRSDMFLTQMTIVNYVSGGETVSALDVSPLSPAIAAVFLASVPPASNSLGAVLFPVLSGAKILLFRFSGGTFTEIPTTNGLNATVSAMIFIN